MSTATIPDEPAPSSQGGSIIVGVTSKTEVLRLNLGELIAGRLLIQGNAGSGKSWLLRRIIEQSYGLLQHIILDPEEEFGGLARRFGYPVVPLSDMEPDALAELAGRVRRHRTSVVIQAGGTAPDDLLERASAFLGGLVEQPREFWHPALVVIDEAHLFAPQGGGASRASAGDLRRAGIAALADLVSRGRKRGLGSVLATQRVAKLAASVASEFANLMVGRNMLERDIQRAADTLGWTMQKAETLRDLAPGTFVAIGPALTSFPKPVRIGPVETQHQGATPSLDEIPLFCREDAEAALGLSSLLSPEAATARIPSGRGGVSGRLLLERFLVMPEAPLAARIVSALADISPNAVEAGNLAQHLGADAAAVERALAVLAAQRLTEARRGAGQHLVRLDAGLRRMLGVTAVTVLGAAGQAGSVTPPEDDVDGAAQRPGCRA